MKTAMRVIAGIILAAILIVGITFGGNALGLWQYSFFAPKYENVRREVFENTQSYIESKRQSLTNYYDEFRKADNTEKLAIRKLMLQEFANFEIENLTSIQQAWYKEMQDYLAR